MYDEISVSGSGGSQEILKFLHQDIESLEKKNLATFLNIIRDIDDLAELEETLENDETLRKMIETVQNKNESNYLDSKSVSTSYTTKSANSNEQQTNEIQTNTSAETASTRLDSDIVVYPEKLRDFLTESFLALAKTVLLCGAALAVGMMPGPSRGNLWPLFNPQVYGPEISTYPTDPYTFLHFEDGILAYLAWGWWGWSELPGHLAVAFTPLERAVWDDFGGLILGLIVGYLFEVAENSEYVINELRANHGTSQFYQGDSRINSFVDILALGIGYSMTKVCFNYGIGWFPVLWLVFSEIISFLTFRDNLLLALIQLVAPMEWIKEYQEGLVPDHLKDVMRVGYWNNKIRDSPEQFLDKLIVSPAAKRKFAKYSRITHRDLKVSREYWDELNTRAIYRL